MKYTVSQRLGLLSKFLKITFIKIHHNRNSVLELLWGSKPDLFTSNILNVRSFRLNR